MNIEKEKMDKVIDLASQKLGMSKSEILASIEKGNLDKALSKMNSKQQTKVNEILSDPEKAKDLLESPAAKAFLKNILEGKK